MNLINIHTTCWFSKKEVLKPIPVVWDFGTSLPVSSFRAFPGAALARRRMELRELIARKKEQLLKDAEAKKLAILGLAHTGSDVWSPRNRNIQKPSICHNLPIAFLLLYNIVQFVWDGSNIQYSLCGQVNLGQLWEYRSNWSCAPQPETDQE